MAKIERIKLYAKEFVSLRQVASREITISTIIHFHPVDLQFQMEYQLHLFLVNAMVSTNAHFILSNWDSAEIYDDKNFRENVLDHLTIRLNAVKPKITVNGFSIINNLDIAALKGLKVFGSLVPAISKATAWSGTYLFDLQFK